MNTYPALYTPPSSEEDSKPPFNCNNGEEIKAPSPYIPNSYLNLGVSAQEPYLRMKEQPIDRFRFRYKSEMAGTHGSLNGISTERIKTYPTVELCNFNEPAIIRCSLSQLGAEVDPDAMMPHAHRLIKKVGNDERDDPHDIAVSPEFGYVASFHSMGIIHTAKKHILTELIRKKAQLKKEEIARREGKYRELKIHEEFEIKGLAEQESKSINLNIVCLRFDAYVKTPNDILKPICQPIFSHGINNLKSALTGELKIVRMDHCTSPSIGNREIFILVEKVTKKNIKIRFFQIDDDETEVWEDYGRFNDLDVHHQYAIVFKTPPYRDKHIMEKVKVYIELVRPSDNARSEPKEFMYTPSEIIGNKRLRSSSYSTSAGYNSSLSSGDLPEPLTEFAQSLESLSFSSNVNSEELNRALANVDSEEFNKIFCRIEPNYTPLIIDAPSNKTKLQNSLMQQRITSREVTAIHRVYDELRSVLQAQKDEAYMKDLLSIYFGKGRSETFRHNNSSPLFGSIRLNNSDMVSFFLKLFSNYNMTNLINVVNANSETAVHIAIKFNHNVEIIKNILSLNPNLALKDSKGNTPLHLTVMYEKGVIMYHLLNTPNVKDFINEENDDGNTALQIAIDNEHVKFVKLLCQKKADVNKKHKKDGSISLHAAVRKQNIEIVKYLLENTSINTEAVDFSGCSPLKTAHALMKDDNKISCEIYKVIKNHMEKTGHATDIEIKQEVEDSSDDEMEDNNFKKEALSVDEMKALYNNISTASPEWITCLDKVSKLLDETQAWQHLADLLDLGHLLKTNLFTGSQSPSKALLNVAITKGESVYVIRNFLENLSELQAVSELDNMVLESR